MINKIIASLTLMAFIVLTFSCYATKKNRIETVVSKKGAKAKILALLKKSGEKIKFAKADPGKIVGDKIVGEAVDETKEKKPVSIPISEVALVWVRKFSLLKTCLYGLGGYLVVGIAIGIYMNSYEL